jgi:hypothetical protein
MRVAAAMTRLVEGRRLLARWLARALAGGAVARKARRRRALLRAAAPAVPPPGGNCFDRDGAGER